MSRSQNLRAYRTRLANRIGVALLLAAACDDDDSTNTPGRTADASISAEHTDDEHAAHTSADAGAGHTACGQPYSADPRDETMTGELVRLLPEYATAGEPLNLVYPSARFLPKRVSLLRDRLLEELPPRLKV